MAHFVKPLMAFLIAFVGTLGTRSVAGTPNEIAASFLQRMQTTMKSVNTIQAEFVQKRHLSAFDDSLQSEGKFYFSRAGQLRWEVLKPYRSLLLLNHGDIGKYQWASVRWQRVSSASEPLLRQILSNIAEWSQGKFSSTTTDYNVDASVVGLIKITPKKESWRNFVSGIEIQVDKDQFLMQRVRLDERERDYTTIEFDKVVVNPTLDPKLFDLSEPYH